MRMRFAVSVTMEMEDSYCGFLEYDTVCLVGGYQHFGVTYYVIIHTRFDFLCISLLSHSATCLTYLFLLDLIILILIGLWRSTNCNASHYTVFILHPVAYPLLRCAESVVVL